MSKEAHEQAIKYHMTDQNGSRIFWPYAYTKCDTCFSGLAATMRGYLLICEQCVKGSK